MTGKLLIFKGSVLIMKHVYQVMRYTHDYGEECLATLSNLKEAEKMLEHLNENSKELNMKFWIDTLDVFNDFEDVRIALGKKVLYDFTHGL